MASMFTLAFTFAIALSASLGFLDDDTPCADSPTVDCTELASTMALCHPPTPTAREYCPLYCGYCRPTTTLVPRVCDDRDTVCQNADLLADICSDPDLASSVCPKSCHACNHQACADHPTFPNECTNQTFLGPICSDSHLASTKCPLACGQCGIPKADVAACESAAGYTLHQPVPLCYKFHHSEVVNHGNATEVCQQEGGRLIELDTAAKFNLINQTVHDSTNYGLLDTVWGYWTGGTRTNTTHFHWSDGSTLNTHQFFIPNQPDNLSGNEYCVEVLLKYDFHLNDIRCDKEYIAFICEIPLSSTSD